MNKLLIYFAVFVVGISTSCKSSEKTSNEIVKENPSAKATSDHYGSAKGAAKSTIQEITNAKDKYTSVAKVDLRVSENEVSSYQNVVIDNCNFSFAIKYNDINYVQTKDEKFKTPEGYHVGQTLSELPQNLRNKMTQQSKWAYYIPLKSGWNVAFCEGEFCTDTASTDTWKIKWIFARN